MALKTSTTTIARPSSASLLRVNRRQTSVSIETCGVRSSPTITRAGARVIPDPGVGGCVADVRQQVAYDDEHRGDDGRPHDSRIVALEDRVQAEIAEARNREDRLDEVCAREQSGQIESEKGDER